MKQACKEENYPFLLKEAVYMCWGQEAPDYTTCLKLEAMTLQN